MTEIKGNKRILASIVKIESISKICDPKTFEPATNIQLYNVLGWQVVGKINEFSIGDLAIYFSIDSILPTTEPTDFLEGKRLKTKKILGQYSQGLLLSISSIEIRKKYIDRNNSNYQEFTNLDISKIKIGQDMTEFFGATKFISDEEKQLYTSEEYRLPVFNFVRKTDEERVQNISPNVLNKLIGQKVILLQKYDGTSTSFVSIKSSRLNTDESKTDKMISMIAGRNRIVINEKDGAHYFQVEKKYNILENLLKLDKEYAIQGETVGPKINGNRMKLKEYDFYVFNIYDLEKGEYLDWNKVQEVCNILKIKTVNEVSQEYLKTLNINFDGIYTKEMTDVKLLLNIAENLEYSKDVIAEGYVIKTNSGKSEERVSFKVISNKYLMKYNL